LIAAMQPVSISLPVFRGQAPRQGFLVEKSLFSTFAAHLCGM